VLPATAQALAVVVLAVLPGAAYVWAFERQAGAYGVSAADRTLRLLAVSLIVQLAFSPVAYVVWRLLYRDEPFAGWQFAIAWLGALLLTGVPCALGTALGLLWSARERPDEYQKVRRLLRLDRDPGSALLALAAGSRRAPTAWDAMFSAAPAAHVRVRTKTSGVLIGTYGERSYAGAFPHSRDLLLEDTWEVDAGGRPVRLRGISVLLPPEEIVAVELMPPPGSTR